MDDTDICCDCGEPIEDRAGDPYGLVDEPICSDCYCDWFNIE